MPIPRFLRCAVVTSVLAVSFSCSRASEFLLNSPSEYQVFQRRPSNSAPLILRGTTPAPGRVAVRVQGKSVRGPYDSGWIQVESTGGTPQFSTTITTPAGGWYEVTARFGEAAGEPREIRVSHVGVGEVFVGAGQSNSTNYGEERQTPKSDRVVTFDGSVWRIASDPQPGTFDHSGGGSFWPSLGDALVDALGVPVGFAVTGNGATSVLQWQPRGTRLGIRPTAYGFVKPVGTNRWECDGALFDHLAKRIQSFGPHGIRAVLWHQGESDANQPNPTPRRISQSEYGAALETLIQEQRRAAGWEIPWFVALVSYHVPDDVGSGTIRDAQIELWRRGVALAGPDTDALQGDYRDSGGKGVHFSGKGQRAHGQLWARQVLEWMNRN